MHIALFTYGFPERPDESYTPAVIEHFVSLSETCSITVFAIGADRPGRRVEYNFDRLNVVATGPLSLAGILPRIIWLRRQLLHRHSADPFDLMHGLWHVGSLAAVLAGKILGLPVIASMMGGEIVDIPEIDYGVIRHRKWRWLMRFVFRNADTVTAGSANYLEKIRHFQTGIEKKLQVLPMGVKWQAMPPLLRPSEKVRILTIAAMQPVKNLRMLLDGIAAVKEQNVHWFIAGEGPETADIRQTILKNGLQNRVTLLGWQPSSAFRRTFSQYDLLVNYSLHEAQCMGLVEAAGSGLPILTTPVGVADELLKNGAGITKLDPTDDLASMVCAIIDSLQQRKRQAMAAASNIRAIYDISQTTRKAMALYSGVLHDFPQEMGVNWQEPTLPVSVRLMRLLRPMIMCFLIPSIMHLRKRNADTQVTGLRLHTRLEVFHPKFFFSSAILVSFMDKFNLSGKKVLDIGTGSGIVGIAAAKKGAEVTAVDINSKAVELARENAKHNGVGNRVLCIESNLFGNIATQKFDFIIFNPPFFPGRPGNAEQAAWFAGENYHLLDTFFEKAGGHLAPGGRIVLIVSSDMNLNLLSEKMAFFEYRVVAHQRKSHIFEVFYLLVLQQEKGEIMKAERAELEATQQ